MSCCRFSTWRRSGAGQTATDSFANSAALAQRAEELGYLRGLVRRTPQHRGHRVLGDERADRARRRRRPGDDPARRGAGSMLLNHAPLLIAEQFGTLEAMYPGRIDLGLGRAPGSDQNTMYALRRDPSSADAFPQDVVELQGYLTGHLRRFPGVDAVLRPGLRTSRCTSWVRRCSGRAWPLRSACRTRLHRTSRRPRSTPPSTSYRLLSSGHPGSWNEAVRDRGTQRDRRRHRRRAAREQSPRASGARGAISLYGRAAGGQNTADLTDEQAD